MWVRIDGRGVARWNLRQRHRHPEDKVHEADARSLMATVQCYDPATNSWAQELPDMVEVHSGHFMGRAGNDLVVYDDCRLEEGGHVI